MGEVDRTLMFLIFAENLLEDMMIIKVLIVVGDLRQVKGINSKLIPMTYQFMLVEMQTGVVVLMIDQLQMILVLLEMLKVVHQTLPMVETMVVRPDHEILISCL